MRAERLISLLLLLQVRGRMTAAHLAKELEVSERTIYRDVDALSLAGVPVYGEAGPDGGYALLDSYRTTLTGLTVEEVRALFMLSIPEPLEALGVSQELRSALLKLAAALPAAGAHAGEAIRRRFYLDATGWEHDAASLPHLQTVHQAVLQDRQLHLRFPLPGGVELEQIVDPYGLVAKAGNWYLIYGRRGAIYVQRIATLLDARIGDEPFIRPEDFDLQHFWHAWSQAYLQRRTLYPVTLRVAPSFQAALPRYFGEQLRAGVTQAGIPDAEGWITLDLAFDSLESARDHILACGRGVEVLEPRALRRSIWDYAEQIVALYKG
jgi:predicted DNA-binding transcriptional regulator YafY